MIQQAIIRQKSIVTALHQSALLCLQLVSTGIVNFVVIPQVVDIIYE